MSSNAVIKFINYDQGYTLDIEVPLDISAQDLFVALNRGLRLGINEKDKCNCFFKADKPLALLLGRETLEDFGVRDGTTINFVRSDYNG